MRSHSLGHTVWLPSLAEFERYGLALLRSLSILASSSSSTARFMITYFRSSELLVRRNSLVRFAAPLALLKCSCWHLEQTLKYETSEVLCNGAQNVALARPTWVNGPPGQGEVKSVVCGGETCLINEC